MTDLILFQPSIGGDWCFNSPDIPTGLLYAARLCDKEYKIVLIDQRVERNWKEKLEKELRKRPLAFATTAMTGPQIQNAIDISKFVKEHCKIQVIWGGIHPTILPEQTLKNEYIDIVVRGEGETKLQQIMHAIQDKNTFSTIEGISYKSEGKIYHNEQVSFIEQSSLPPIPYHLIDPSLYKMQKYGGQSMTLMTSTGCPHKCTYCYNTAFGNSWRGIPVEKFEMELQRAIDLYPNLKHVAIEDDNTFGNIAHGKKIVEVLNKYPLTWNTGGLTSTAARTFDDDFLRLLDHSGCKHMHMGVESGSKRILRLIRKPNKIDDIIAFNKKASKYNFHLFYNFMCGFPTETLRDLKQSIKLARILLKDNHNARISFFSIYLPYPGTPLFDLCVRRGFVPPDRLEDWNDYYWKHSKLPWISEEREHMLKRVYFSALFIDNKSEYHLKNKLVKFATKIYRPIARYRMENLNFACMPEYTLKEWYEKILLQAHT
ncbi:B12-binding domain-containing radical SAM protein [Candidatus Woesearchaeota archaeon]|nr:B12-binding domain-containing radical SAM protein [Candidatus Woesearchaeota archaeon]